MTDKEKIRAEIEKYQKQIQAGAVDNRISKEKAEAYRICVKLIYIIDSLQEEPVSNPIDFEKELYKAFGQVKDFTLGMRIAKWFYDMGKNSQEPVSEDLEEAAEDYGIRQGAELKPFAIKFFKAGAMWQKQQDQSTIELAEDHAMFAGMEKMKEQMMEKAVDVTVHIDAGGYPYIPQIELYDYGKDVPLAKEGDKYKVVLIKEE